MNGSNPDCALCGGDGCIERGIIYGLFPGGDPREFDPDRECCSPEEIERWKVACQEWDKGIGSNKGPSCATRGDGSAWTGTGYGIGTYRYEGEPCPDCQVPGKPSSGRKEG